MLSPFRSVAKTWSGICRRAASRNSAQAMAIEYASSPVEHPMDHTRTGSCRERSFTRPGKTLLFRTSKASGFRKKVVTLMSTS
jgi:hypothetical protein